MTIDTTRLRELVEKATKGPYYTTGEPWFTAGSGVLAGSQDPHVGYVIADCEQWEGEREEYLENDGPVEIASGDNDAALIAAALNALPELLDAFDERERLREALKAQMLSTIIAMRSAGHLQADIDDCTSQARAALEGKGK